MVGYLVKAAACLLSLLLIGCGLGGTVAPPNDVILYSVDRYDIYPDFNPLRDFNLPRGRTEWESHGPTRVWVLDDLDWDDTVAVLAHEIWHVAGFEYHLGDPLCISCNATPKILFPCAEEVARMNEVQRVFHLRPTSEIYDATVAAAQWWNNSFDRDMFVVD